VLPNVAENFLRENGQTLAVRLYLVAVAMFGVHLAIPGGSWEATVVLAGGVAFIGLLVHLSWALANVSSDGD
jgi:hypothetical protein